jgi:hypothetical protein
MIALKNDRHIEEFVVIHPLYDEPEQKMSGVELGRMEMSKTVRVSLLLLRGYLILMFMLLGFHILDLAGVFGHHATRL